MSYKESVENVVKILTKYRTEIKAQGYSDSDIDNAITRFRLEATLGVRLDEVSDEDIKRALATRRPQRPQGSEDVTQHGRPGNAGRQSYR